MKSSADPLDRLHIASPCPVGWEQMSGDNRVRFCELCSFHVYNIGEMTRPEVLSLIESTEGRICGRIYRRADGTIITKDCPVGLRAIRRRVSKTAGAVFATIVGLCSGVMGQKPAAAEQTSCPQQVTFSRKVTDAATTSGVISGVITDFNKSVVPGAKVTITDTTTKKVIETISNTEGRFVVGGIEPGTYLVAFSAPGFVNLEVKELKIAAQEVVTFDTVVLNYQMLTGIMSVAPIEPSMLDKSPSNKTVFSGDMIRRLPH